MTLLYMIFMKSVSKPIIAHPDSLSDNIMTLQLSIGIFEKQYKKFMDQKTWNEFDTIKNAANMLECQFNKSD